jgi:hypothetical protein
MYASPISVIILTNANLNDCSGIPDAKEYLTFVSFLSGCLEKSLILFFRWSYNLDSRYQVDHSCSSVFKETLYVSFIYSD